MSFALLWLEGPLQSWGADSKFGRRATLAFPTRSGILGLVCGALGKTGSQEEWLSKWQGLSQTVAAFARKGIKPPFLKDFHTVGNGYDAADPWQDLLVPKKSDGKRPSTGGGPKLTSRHYLQDMAFSCALELPDDEKDAICAGLQFPVWNICLGRKCCVPTEQVFQGLFETEESAFEKAQRMGESKERIEILRVGDCAAAEKGERLSQTYGGVSERGERLILNDAPLSFGRRKRYRERTVFTICAGRLPQEV